jgi:hypothetical protein
MKKISKVLFLFIAVFLFAVADSKAQVSVYVGVRPPRPAGVVLVRPSRPSPRHVWVAEEWSPAGGTYAYHAGYWALPPRPGAVWIAGHWRHGRRGYFWVPGHWA